MPYLRARSGRSRTSIVTSGSDSPASFSPPLVALGAEWVGELDEGAPRQGRIAEISGLDVAVVLG